MTKVQKDEFDYASKMAELEEVLASLQDSALSVDNALQLHKKGNELVLELENYLKEAEVVIRKHTGL